MEGKEAGSEQNLKDTLQNLSKNFYETIEKSKEQANDKEYISNTNEALNKGIFGAPSFSVGNEIFGVTIGLRMR